MVRQLVERRFPLDLKPSLGPIHALYVAAKAAHWDPERDVRWADFSTEAYSPEARAAAALVWSHRVWLGYGHLAATPALLVRFCLEHRREADAKYFLSVRGSEDAWYVDAAARFAEALGGFVEEPPDTCSKTLFETGDHVTALDADVPLESYIAADVALRLQIEADQLAGARDNNANPIAVDVLSRLENAKRRHAEFGWRYLAARGDAMDEAQRDVVRERLSAQLTLERAGLNAPALGATQPLLVDAYHRAQRAGLGGLSPEQSVATYRESLATAERRLKEVGIEWSST